MTTQTRLEELLSAALSGPSAATARAAVAGAIAALRTTPATEVTDPARAAAAVLVRLLATAVQDEPPEARSKITEARPALSGRRTALLDLAVKFTDDPAVRLHLGSTPIESETEAETWSRMWLACLRLPASLAVQWRDRASGVLAARGPSGDSVWAELPGDGEVLVQPAPVFGVTGLRESPGVGAHPEVAALAELRCDEIPVLTSQVLGLMERDRTLHHALESRRKYGFHPLSKPDNYQNLLTDLRYRISDLAAAPLGSLRALEELRLLDEVLCSVVHRPPAHPDSWWGRLARRSRQTLAAAAADLRGQGEDVQIRVLEPGSDYATQRDLLGQFDVAYPVSELHDGEILACLRVWMRTTNGKHVGRVVFARNPG